MQKRGYEDKFMGKRRRMDWKGRVCRKLNPDGIAIRMIQNEGFRLGIFAVCGFAFNIIFAVFNGIVGWLGSSPWFGTLSAYYILLSAMRCYWLVKRSAHAGAKQQKRRKIRKSLCRRYGIFFCCMAVVLGGEVILLIHSEGGKEYPGIVIYAVASYTFCKIIFAVINVFRARKKRALSLMIIRDIGYVDACVSILSLQTAMVAQFGGGEEAFARMMNGITGTAVCLMILGLGIYYMLLAGKGTKRKWRSKNDDTYPCCGR